MPAGWCKDIRGRSCRGRIDRRRVPGSGYAVNRCCRKCRCGRVLAERPYLIEYWRNYRNNGNDHCHYSSTLSRRRFKGITGRSYCRSANNCGSPKALYSVSRCSRKRRGTAVLTKWSDRCKCWCYLGSDGDIQSGCFCTKTGTGCKSIGRCSWCGRIDCCGAPRSGYAVSGGYRQRWCTRVLTQWSNGSESRYYSRRYSNV